MGPNGHAKALTGKSAPLRRVRHKLRPLVRAP